MEALRARKGTKPIPVQFPLEQQGEPIPQHLTPIATKCPGNARPAYVYLEDGKYVYQRRKYGWIRCRRCQRLANPPEDDGNLSGSNDEEENGGCRARWILEDDGFYHFHPHDPRSGVAHNHGYDRERIREIVENPLFPRAIPRNMNNPDGIELDEVFQELNLSGNNVNDRDERNQFLEARNQTLEETNAQLIIEIDDLKRQLREKEKQLSDKERQLKEVQTRCNELTAEILEKEKMIENLQKTVDEKQAKIDELRKACEIKENVIAGLRLTTKGIQGSLSALQKLRNVEKTRIKDFEGKLAEAKASEEQEKIRLEKLTAEIGDLKTINAQHLDTIAQRVADINQLRTQLEHLEARLLELEAKVVQLEAEVKQQQLQIRDLKGAIAVFIRFRPTEIRHDHLSIVNNTTLRMKNLNKHGEETRPPYEFMVNKVFKFNAKTEEVFHEASDLIVAAVQGSTTYVFAYGQTGSGKTHTMGGKSGTDADAFVPRSTRCLFETLEGLKADGWEFKVTVSFTDIYLEDVYDLLDGDEGKKIDGILKKTENRELVASYAETIELMSQVQRKRHFAPTLVNARSTRGHFTTTFFIEGTMPSAAGILETTSGRLMLVDLAGNENLEQSGAKGATADEATAINKSLITLQQVLRDLAEGKTPTFRGSKLTLMLKSAFQSHKKPKMLMLAHISLDPQYYFQTKTTLKFAQEVVSFELGAKTRPANVNPVQIDAVNRNHPSQAASGRLTVETRPPAEPRRGIPTGRQRAGNIPIAGAQNVQPPSTALVNVPPVIDPFAPNGGARRKVPPTTNQRGGRK